MLQVDEKETSTFPSCQSKPPYQKYIWEVFLCCWASGFCHHTIGLLFYLAHCKQLGLTSLPDDLTCTSIPQRWSIPRNRKIECKQIQDILVKKPQMTANYSKYIKTTLYSPSKKYELLTKAHFGGVEPEPLMKSIVPSSVSDLENIDYVVSKFGNVPKGSVLSYQQKLSNDYVLNDFFQVYPDLPLENSGQRFENNVNFCLDKDKQALIDSLTVTRDVSIDLEKKTLTQSSSNLWHLLRKKRITASKFGLCVKRISHFENLVQQLNPSRQVLTANMWRGIEMESEAAMVYANIARSGLVNLYPSGLIINPKCPWLGTPDRKIYDIEAQDQGIEPIGLLEIKVVREGLLDFANVSYLTTNPLTNELQLKRNHDYFYQIQCQLGLTGVQWCDFFSYINNAIFFFFFFL